MAKTYWKDEYFVRVFELARSGFSEKRIAASLGVSQQTFERWKEAHPAIDDAIQKGRRAVDEKGNNDYSFKDYVYHQLPQSLQHIWDAIDACEQEPSGRNRVEALLEEGGVNARKHLFLYAIVASNFSLSEACRKLGMSRKVYRHWLANDPDFVELMDEIHWHKQNFFEEHLVRLVKSGDAAATIFVNKTFNKDRGYSEKVEVDIRQAIGISVKGVPLDSLQLDLDTRRKLLDAMRGTQTIDEEPSRVIAED